MKKLMIMGVVTAMTLGASTSYAERKRGEPVFERNSISNQMRHHQGSTGSRSAYSSGANSRITPGQMGVQPFQPGDRVTNENKWEYARRGQEMADVYNDPNYQGERDFSKVHPSLNKDGSMDADEFQRLLKMMPANGKMSISVGDGGVSGGWQSR